MKDEAADRAEWRLRDGSIVWLASVSPGGQPQVSPVGYVWDGMTILIVSRPDTPKIRNLSKNPRVALHLDLDAEGGVLTIEGRAEVTHAPPGGAAQLTEAETAAYLAKHLESMTWAELTPAEFFADYSSVIRIAVTRARIY
ncbi:pyridoxamine 5'-phosphate oxidase family protein [Kribbella solani]|uniref:pyridoxamine 5'-phosphate oxidase family protein n=1 Tax=Kribbella solani TaxID=236067 RepID=UPI0029B9758D|nr:pyridoxamine 5'-phosphate oxidase family protein [Kribbella solani]MDX3003448.1 pyridoxamine 5'-phosphate oxidase family protein [Kribbella solani]